MTNQMNSKPQNSVSSQIKALLDFDSALTSGSINQVQASQASRPKQAEYNQKNSKA
jgi:hypothetical protein